MVVGCWLLVEGLRVCEGGAPIGGAQVFGVAGEEPAVAVEVFGCVLELAVDGLVRLFDDVGAFGFGVGVVGFDVFDEDGKVLRSEA